MSMMADDPNEILKQMQSQLGEIEIPDDIVDVTKLSDQQLTDLIIRLDEELIQDGQLMQPTTEEARDKHSLRGAAIIERNNRRKPLT